MAPEPTPTAMTLVKTDAPLQPFIKYIAVGSDLALETQLIEKSRQPNILKHTPNDAKERFGNHAMFQRWLARGREVHWLVGADHDLAGIVWYGQKRFPLEQVTLSETPQETVAIRLYDGYTGHHLAVPVMQQSLRLAVRRKQARGEPVVGLWLQTDASNAAAIATYSRCAYREVARDESRVTMVLPAAAILAEARL